MNPQSRNHGRLQQTAKMQIRMKFDEMETTKQAETPTTVQPDEKGRFWLFLPNGQKT